MDPSGVNSLNPYQILTVTVGHQNEKFAAAKAGATIQGEGEEVLKDGGKTQHAGL